MRNKKKVDAAVVRADDGQAEPDGRAGIQSIEVGAPLLAALVRSPVPMPLSSLAAEAGMAMSKAHKYLTSFARVGLVQKVAASGHYDFGSFALELGLAALSRLDIVERAYPAMLALSREIDETVTLTVWSRHGATIVRLVENTRPVAVTVRLGAALALLTSSNGRIFLSWLDPAMTSELLRAELAEPAGPARRAGLRTSGDVERLIASTRARGLAEVQGLAVPGIVGLSAPVFGPAGLVAGLTVVAAMGGIDVSDRGTPATALRRYANSLSQALGGRVPSAP